MFNNITQQQAIDELRRRGVQIPTPDQPQEGSAQQILPQTDQKTSSAGVLSNLGQSYLNWYLSNTKKTLQETLAGLAQMGHGLLSAPHNIASLFSNKLAQEIPAPAPQDYNKLLGIQPGIPGEIVENVSQYLPAMLTGGETIPGQMAAGGVFGATQSQNPLTGALLAAAIPGALGVPSIVGKFLKGLSPKGVANELVSHLSQGQTLGENNQSIAKAIMNSYQDMKDLGKSRYDKIKNLIGDNQIYQSRAIYGPGMGQTLQKEGSQYLNLPDEIINSFDSDLTKSHNNFLNNPTFNSAHNLQSQIGQKIGDLKELKTKSGLNQSESNDLNNLGQARNSIRNDMQAFVDRAYPNLSSDYQNATDFWRQNVVPYAEQGAIRQMALGKVKNPPSSLIMSAFKFPLEGEFKGIDPDEIDAINKIRGDLGPDLDRKIIYSQVGKLRQDATPKQVISKLQNLPGQGLEDYFYPELTKRLENLQNVSELGKGAKTVGGAAAGGIIGRKAGLVGEGLGALSGALLSQKLLGPSGAPALIRGSAKALQGIKSAYAPTSRALTAALTPYLVNPGFTGYQDQGLQNISQQDAINELKRRGISIDE